MREAILFIAGMHNAQVTFGRIAFHVAMTILTGLMGAFLLAISIVDKNSAFTWIGIAMMLLGSLTSGLIIAAITCKSPAPTL